MKNKLIFMISMIVLGCLMLSNCAKNESNSTFVNEKRVEYAFYNPKVNSFNNMERKIVFNSDLLKTEEMDYLKNGIVKKLIGDEFNQLAGISIYYNNAILNQNVKFTNDNILGIIIYELDKEGLMRNRFFIKNAQNKYEQKLSLLENMMSTTNQVFLVYKFFPEIYKSSTIGICTLSDVNLNSQEILKQKNEFDLFRVANTFQRVKFNRVLFKTDEEGNYFRGVACMNCAEDGMGTCERNLYCVPNPDDVGAQDPDTSISDGDSDSICPEKQSRYAVFNSGVLTQTVAESLFNLDLHRRLRDNLMKNYNVGEKYIEYYYAIGGFLQSQDYPADTLLKMISSLPDFNTSIEKLIDQTNNGSEIIITESLRNDMFAIITDLQAVSDNPDYQYILTDLKVDLDAIKNKTKDQLLNELH